MAAELEEAVVAPDRRDAQQLSPERRQRLLGGGGRRGPGRLQGRSRMPFPARRGAGPLRPCREDRGRRGRGAQRLGEIARRHHDLGEIALQDALERVHPLREGEAEDLAFVPQRCPDRGIGDQFRGPALRAPGAPVDGDHPRSAAAAAAAGEGAEERVGGAVVDLPDAACQRVDRGEQDEEFGRIVGEDAVEDQGALHLGAQRPQGGLPRLELQEPGARHARGMEDAVDAAEAPARPLHGAAHRRGVRNVGGEGEHLGAGGHQLPRSLGAPFRKDRPAGEHQPRSGDRPRQMVGEGQAEGAQAAGDQVRPPLREESGPFRGRGQGHWREEGGPAVRAAPGDEGIGRRIGQLGEQPVAEPRPDLAGIDVDQAAGDPRVLLGDHPERAEEGRLLGMERVPPIDVAQAVGDDADLDRPLPVPRRQRLGEGDQGLVAARLRLPGLLPRGSRAQTPEMKDAAGHHAEVGEQGVEVAGGVGVEGVAPRLVAAEGLARPGRRHRAAGRGQALRQMAAETERVEEHEPAAGEGSRSAARPGRPLPGRGMEPGGPVRQLFRRHRRRTERGGAGSRLGPRFDPRFDPRFEPIPLAFERIRRQGHPAAPLAAVEAGPVDLHAGEPEAAQGLEQEPLVRLPVELVAQRGEDGAAPPLRPRRRNSAGGPGCPASGPAPSPAAPVPARATARRRRRRSGRARRGGSPNSPGPSPGRERSRSP